MTRKDVIKQVLTDFLGEDSNVDEDNLIPLVLDEVEIDIVTNAINQALEKRNASTN